MSLSAFSYRDSAVVKRQMSHRVFDERIVSCVSRRCRWGCPQVIMCKPYVAGMPFPTLFWLTCPYLSRICGAVETDGGVGDLEDYILPYLDEYKRYNTIYALVRLSVLNRTERSFLHYYNKKVWNTLRTTGIGGIRQGKWNTVKCIHLQLATYLSLKGHPGTGWFQGNIVSFCCQDPVSCVPYSCRT